MQFSTDTGIIELVLVNIVKDMVQDWGIELDGDINRRTLMVAELGFGSIDIIQYCVAIEQHYTFQFGFQDLLMNNGRYVSDLSISQTAEFLKKRLEENTR